MHRFYSLSLSLLLRLHEHSHSLQRSKEKWKAVESFGSVSHRLYLFFHSRWFVFLSFSDRRAEALLQ